MAKKLTKDEQRILTSGEEDFNFVTSGSWRRIKQKLLHKLVTSDSVSSVEFTGRTDEQIVREIVGRAHATALIFEWIRDVENDAAIQKDAKEAMLQVREEIFFTAQRSQDEILTQH